ncbi:DegV family protein [Oribacterium asaccharolyticum]|uniref:DegV family protein n=1 Tax=Oribacterium asaccharolyticum TaxID=1501332 RepID=UPI0028E9A630|nr:DegV family protein [Oribacterium asaccharolyticum]
MENYILSCCSTMDLRKGWAEERGVNLIYAKFFLEGEEFRDDFYESISQDKLFERMLSGEKSQTTQVNTEEYIGSFRKYLEQGQDIFHICLSSGVSGTFNSCHIAKDILLEEFPERKIEIVDSLMASCGYGLLVDKACELKKQGLDMETLRIEVEKWRNRLHGYFFTSDLRFFIQGGRVSKAAGFIGGLLKICPVLKITEEGKLKPIEKARGKKQAMENILSKMEKEGYLSTEKCFISHSACPLDAKKLAESIRDRFHPEGSIEIFDIGGTIACHTGPGTVSSFFFGKEKA